MPRASIAIVVGNPNLSFHPSLLQCSIAKKYSAYTIGTVGSSLKIEFLKKEGYDDVIVRDNNFKENLRQSLGQKELKIVLESIGGKIFKESFNLLSPTGRIIFTRLVG